ncbi:MAG TPA: ATP-binding protein [Clostridia bacterium]|nr:ATP-binding protein [Clostridia bacterium]
MSIKIKLPLLVLAAFIVNILLVMGYYSLFLSREISSYNNEVQEGLRAETAGIINEAENSSDFRKLLEDISEKENLVIQVSDESGAAIFHTGKMTGVNVVNNASGLFHHEGHIYLLNVTKPMNIKYIASYNLAWDIFIAEAVIILIILLFSAIPVYLDYAKPIMALQKNMERYKEGIRPRSVTRKDEIGLLQNRFVTLTEAIEKEKQKQNLIIASISHDIKTPLTSIMGFTERLKKGSLQVEKYEQYIDIIYNKSVSINNLVEEFDEYLNLHIKNSLKLQKISAEKFCAILKSDYEEELNERGVAFSVSIGCPQELLSVDISKMRRVFGNIISNSLKHFDRKEPAIAVSCSRLGDSVLFSVEDNGTGIPEEDIPKIFDPFYTSDKGRTVAGLGLAICREIVEACGGRIWAENRESGGTSVKMDMPLKNA